MRQPQEVKRSSLHANGGPALGRRRNVRISQLLFSYGKLCKLKHWLLPQSRVAHCNILPVVHTCQPHNGQWSTLHARLGSLFEAQGTNCEIPPHIHQRMQKSKNSGSTDIYVWNGTPLHQQTGPSHWRHEERDEDWKTERQQLEERILHLEQNAFKQNNFTKDGSNEQEVDKAVVVGGFVDKAIEKLEALVEAMMRGIHGYSYKEVEIIDNTPPLALTTFDTPVRATHFIQSWKKNAKSRPTNYRCGRTDRRKEDCVARQSVNWRNSSSTWRLRTSSWTTRTSGSWRASIPNPSLWQA